MDIAAFYGDSVAVVTGAASGIGKAIVSLLTRAGASVFAVDRDAAALAALQADIPGVCTLPLDVTDEDAGQRMLSCAVERYGRVDIFFNNAGIYTSKRFEELSPAEMQRIVAVNLLAPIRLTRAFLEYFRQRNAGTIAFTGSLSAHLHSPQSIYTATKGGLHGFVAALRRELPDNSAIRLSIIHPGTTKTGFFSADELKALDGTPLSSADEVARAFLHGIAQGRNEILITLRDRISVWIERIWPGYFDARFRSLGQDRK